MATYWALLSIPLFGVISSMRLQAKTAWLVWTLIGISFTLIIGLRYQVGGDWQPYLGKVSLSAHQTLLQSLGDGAPAYWFLNWFGSHIGGGIYFVNLVCGAVFMTGLILFVRNTASPWLTFYVAVPYLLIVVVMGYSRQGAAIGIELIALRLLADGQRMRFVACILIAGLFHKTAIVMLPLAALGGDKRRIWALVWVGGTGAAAFSILMLDRFQVLWTNYVDQDMQSEGASIRVIMTAIPAILLLVFSRRLNDNISEQRLWNWLSFAAICCLPLLSLASTMVDRVALYLIPVQLHVFSRLPRLGDSMLSRTGIVVAIVIYYGVVQFVWLNFASHAPDWLPYRWMPFT